MTESSEDMSDDEVLWRFLKLVCKGRQKNGYGVFLRALITLLNAKRAIILLLRSKKEWHIFSFPMPGLAQKPRPSKNISQKNGLFDP